MRASVLTDLVTGLAAAAHQSAGGHLPPAALMPLLAALVMVSVTVLSRRRLSISVLAGILAGGQGLLHVAFNALSGTGYRSALRVGGHRRAQPPPRGGNS